MSRVDEYTHGALTVNFPADNQACKYCPCCRKDYDSDRRRCWVTGEWLGNFKSRRGDKCPIIMAREVEDGNA